MDCQNRLGQGWLVEGHQKAVARTLRKIYYTGYCKELTAVSGFCIQEDAAGMYLVGVQLQSQKNPKIWVIQNPFLADEVKMKPVQYKVSIHTR